MLNQIGKKSFLNARPLIVEFFGLDQDSDQAHSQNLSGLIDSIGEGPRHNYTASHSALEDLHKIVGEVV